MVLCSSGTSKYPYLYFNNHLPNIGLFYHLWVSATPIGGWRGAEKSANEWTKYAISICLSQEVRKECFIILIYLQIFVNVINVLPPTENRGWYLDVGNVYVYIM